MHALAPFVVLATVQVLVANKYGRHIVYAKELKTTTSSRNRVN